MLSWFLVLATAMCVFLKIVWNRKKYYMLTLKIPGPLGYPIIGMAHKLMKRENILRVFHENEEKYGPLVFSWLGPFPFLIINEPQFAQDILVSPACVNKGFIYHALDDGTGKGLFSLQDPEWSAHRRLLNPAFSHRVLQSFMPIFNREGDRLATTIDGLAHKGEIDLTEIFQEFTLNIATQTTMGNKQMGAGSVVNKSLIQSYKCILWSMADMCFSPWLRYSLVQRLLGKYAEYDQSKKEIRTFIRTLIKESIMRSEESKQSIADNAENASKMKNFIHIAIDLLKSGAFSWQNVEDEANVIVFGAYETTANTIAYTLMMLSMFPIYQQRAFEEIATLFPNKDDVHVTYADTQQMVYLDMILNETMRVMAPVPIISRQAANDFQLSNGIVIPKGTQIAIDIFFMHRRQDIWGAESHIFNPDNFLPSNLENKHSYSFIPFTKGIRNCIGWKYALMSTKVILAKLIRNFRFTTKFNYADLQFVEDITIKLKKVPLLEIEKRS